MQKALLVDDSKSARVIISRLLHKLGFEVFTVESGEEALEYIKKNIPDLIFMDYMMPGLSGIETMHRIHAEPRTANLPVVMCTGNEGEGYEEEVMNEGAASMLTKPPSVAGIQKAMADINKMMEKQRSLHHANFPANDKSLQQAVNAAVADLRTEFDQKLAAMRQELTGTATSQSATANAQAGFQLLHLEIEASKKSVLDAVVQRMQQQQAKLFDTLKEIMTKQRTETMRMIKKTMGKD